MVRSIFVSVEKENPVSGFSINTGRVLSLSFRILLFLVLVVGLSPEVRADPASKESERGKLLAHDKTLLERIMVLSQKDLSFATGKANLSRRDRRILREDAVLLKRYPKVEILLIGHSDERGNQIYNFRLGLDRGKSARQFLEDLGIAPSRIHVVSFGKRAIPGRLLCARHRESCWRRHRIVHIVGYLPDERVAFRSSPPPQPMPPPPARVVTVQGEKRRKGTYLLLPAGKVEVENVFLYLHDTSTQVASQNFSLFPILPATTGVNIQRVDEDYYVEMIAVFLGVTDKLELEADVPYVYRTQTAVTSPVNSSGGTGTPTLTNQFGRGLGDIDYGVHYQFNSEPFLGGALDGQHHRQIHDGDEPFHIAREFCHRSSERPSDRNRVLVAGARSFSLLSDHAGGLLRQPELHLQLFPQLRRSPRNHQPGKRNGSELRGLVFVQSEDDLYRRIRSDDDLASLRKRRAGSIDKGSPAGVGAFWRDLQRQSEILFYGERGGRRDSGCSERCDQHPVPAVFLRNSPFFPKSCVAAY